MFTDLIEALKAQDLEIGEAVTLKQLCADSGLNSGVLADRCGFASTRFLIMEELEPEGFTIALKFRGKRKTFQFVRVK